MTGHAGPDDPEIDRRLAWGVVVLAALAVAVSQGFGRFSYGLLLPGMTRDFLGSYGLAGTFGTLNLAAYLVGMVGVSVVSSRVQPRQLVLIGLVGTLVGMVTIGTARSTAILLVGLLVMGLFAAGTWVPATSLVSAVVPGRRRGVALGAVVAGPGLSMLAAGQLTAWIRGIVHQDAWREVWLLQAGIGASVVVAAVLVLRRVPDVDMEPGAFALRVLRRLPRWWAVSAAYAAFGLGYMIFMTYLVAALEADAGFSASDAARTYSLLGLASVAGGLLLGRLSDRLGRRRLLVAVMATCGLATGGVVLGQQPWVAVSAVGFGIAMSGTGAVMAALVGDHLRGGSVGAAFGMLTAIFATMQMLAPQVGGWLVERTGGFRWSFAVSAMAFLTALVLAACLPRDAVRVSRRGSDEVTARTP